MRRTLERRVRAAWRREPPPAALRAAEVLFGAAVDLRHLLYDAGVLASRPAGIPVVSVGGLTVGGSGKTPLAAEVASWLAAAGRRPAVVTRGYPDELAVHRALGPEVVLRGHPDRRRAVSAARAAGADVAVLDDGFQHRRLRRALDLVVVDLDALSRTNRRRLPAGPFRERAGEVARAGAVVVAGRETTEEASAAVAGWLRRRLPGTPVARCAIAPGRVSAWNEAARLAAAEGRPARPGPEPAGGAEPRGGGAPRDPARATPPDPAVALTGVMKPRLFFRQARARFPGIALERSFPDHARPSPELLEECVRAAGGRGMLSTLKDAVKLAPLLPRAVPLWVLDDVLLWGEGREALRRRVLAAARGGSDRP